MYQATAPRSKLSCFLQTQTHVRGEEGRGEALESAPLSVFDCTYLKYPCRHLTLYGVNTGKQMPCVQGCQLLLFSFQVKRGQKVNRNTQRLCIVRVYVMYVPCPKKRILHDALLEGGELLKARLNSCAILSRWFGDRFISDQAVVLS